LAENFWTKFYPRFMDRMLSILNTRQKYLKYLFTFFTYYMYTFKKKVCTG
jgi:hypothetical protein